MYKLNIPLTIEKQLESYIQKEEHTDRHEALWHAWRQNKRWLSQILQMTLQSFPTYSRHDESHALSVLNNIEMLLGQERIADLSATDCFVLLHTVYIHDLGMCITRQDRKEIIENEEFARMLDRLQTEGDETTKSAVECLKRTDYERDNKKDYYEQEKELYKAKLEVYYAIVELLADFRRTEHGEKSAERLYEWTLNPEKLGTGFSMAGVPLRIFLAIARCAQMHTSGRFEELKKLPKKDGGYASDYYHPRFISVLLMLGDILDMDNDRFHPMVFEFVEDFPESSRNHFDKHRAIRRLHISPEKIEIEADCRNQNALRLVRKECDMLAEILQNAGYMWSDICPEKFKGSLPVLAEAELYLNGQKIPEELVTAQFNISQKKAFSILEGANLYEGRFVFLREFLQNAVDATKIQYWRDYTGMESHYFEQEKARDKSPDRMNQELPLDKYPVEVSMKMQKKRPKEPASDITEEDVLEIKRGGYRDYRYGILVSIKDFGTGIDKESILKISQVGNSRHEEWKTIQDMPKWLRPTAEFGVGLQSAFLLAQDFKCYTHTRSGERYEITFHSGSSLKYQGYINVIPREKFEGKKETYGTCFEVFVPLDKKFKHDESLNTWGGEDLFDEEYERNRPFRHAGELISQMALYLDNMLGEMLFPVVLKIVEVPEIRLVLGTKKWNSIKKMIYCQKGEPWRTRYKKSWIFKKTEKNPEYFFGEIQELAYAYEYNTCKLFLWNKKIDTFCVVSGSSLLEREEEYQKNRQKEIARRGITIYYKGIKLQCKCVEEEIEMFEYIDIKGELQRSCINISRRGFTPEGTKYFEQEIYTELLSSVKRALRDMNVRINREKAKNEGNNAEFDGDNTEKRSLLSLNVRKKFDEYISLSQENRGEEEKKKKVRQIAEQLLTLAFLSFLTEKGTKDEMSRFGEDCGEEEVCNWNESVQELSQILKDKRYKVLREDLKSCSKLFNIDCYLYAGTDTFGIKDEVHVLDIFSREKHYGILQRRENKFGTWVSYIIALESKTFQLCQDAVLGETQKIRKESEEKLEQELEKILFFAKNMGTTALEEHKYEQQFFLNWLSKNMPTIGVGSNEEGNIRFNVLSNYIFSSIYTNQNHKMLILERVLEVTKEKGIRRFSIYAWQERQYLSVENLPFSCYFIKRGYLNTSSLRRVIVPFESSLLMKIEGILGRIEEHSFVKNIRSLSEALDFKDYCSQLARRYNEKEALSDEEGEIFKKIEEAEKKTGQNLTSLAVDMSHDLTGLWEQLLKMEEGKEHKERSIEIDDSYYERIKRKKRRWEELYQWFLKLSLELILGFESAVKELEQLQGEKDMLFLAKGWQFLNKAVESSEEIEKHLELPGIKRDYMYECQNNPQVWKRNQRIIEFIFENTKYSIQRERVELCYKAFSEELFQLFEEMELRELKEVLKKIPRTIG